MRSDVTEVEAFRRVVDGSDGSVQGLASDLGGGDEDVASLKALWQARAVPARRIINVRSRFKPWEAVAHVVKLEQEAKRARVAERAADLALKPPNV